MPNPIFYTLPAFTASAAFYSVSFPTIIVCAFTDIHEISIRHIPLSGSWNSPREFVL